MRVTGGHIGQLVKQTFWLGIRVFIGQADTVGRRTMPMLGPQTSLNRPLLSDYAIRFPA